MHTSYGILPAVISIVRKGESTVYVCADSSFTVMPANYSQANQDNYG